MFVVFPVIIVNFELFADVVNFYFTNSCSDFFLTVLHYFDQNFSLFKNGRV